MEIRGYRRPDGGLGIRNHVAVIYTVECAKMVAGEIGSQFEGAQVFGRRTGCDWSQPIFDKLVALGRLTAGLAHEVRNPLNAMMIHLELLRTKIRKGAIVAEPRPEPVAASRAIEGWRCKALARSAEPWGRIASSAFPAFSSASCWWGRMGKPCSRICPMSAAARTKRSTARR